MSIEPDASTGRTFVERVEGRKTTNWIAAIRLWDGTEIPCNVKDVSKSGARLGVPAYQELPDTFMLRIIGRDFLCLVKLVWRRGDYTSVSIARVAKVPAAPVPPIVEAEAPVKAESETQGPVRSGGVGVRSSRRGLSAF